MKTDVYWCWPFFFFSTCKIFAILQSVLRLLGNPLLVLRNMLEETDSFMALTAIVARSGGSNKCTRIRRSEIVITKHWRRFYFRSSHWLSLFLEIPQATWICSLVQYMFKLWISVVARSLWVNSVGGCLEFENYFMEWKKNCVSLFHNDDSWVFLHKLGISTLSGKHPGCALLPRQVPMPQHVSFSSNFC